MKYKNKRCNKVNSTEVEYSKSEHVIDSATQHLIIRSDADSDDSQDEEEDYEIFDDNEMSLRVLPSSILNHFHASIERRSVWWKELYHCRKYDYIVLKMFIIMKT